MRGHIIGIVGSAAIVFVACGGGNASVQMANNGQSKLADKTFAGSNRCNAKNHNRPFIIEWDATDMSSFQAFTSTDVVFVHYEGCDLQVLDGCRNDSNRGALGSYRPITWTSGSMESIDIANQDELYAKLPLGAATLAPRVESGEQFHMEYYVSGTRTATRDAVFRSDLAKNPSCASATHFVYGYNLGAFALASRSKLGGAIGGSYFGFGAGGSKTSTSHAEKKGGEISACTGDSAHEIESCKVPVRLTLRPVSDGANPDVTASQAPDTDASLNLAGRVQVSADRQKQARERTRQAREKQTAGDGTGCLAELDAHDQLEPEMPSTNPRSGEVATLRTRCLMLSGQCAAGRDFGVKVLDAEGVGDASTRIEIHFPASRSGFFTVGEFCRSNTASPRDQYLHAFFVLQFGAGDRLFNQGECQAAKDTVMRVGVPHPDGRLYAPGEPERGGMSPTGMSSLVARCPAGGGGIDKADQSPSLPVPPPPAATTRFRVGGDTVEDLKTGLTWQRVLAAGNEMDFATAQRTCNGLSLAGGGWRLPTRDELMSIVDMTDRQQPGHLPYVPKIDETFFPSTPTVTFWTSTVVSDAVWVVNFRDGVNYHARAGNPNRVRCVRGSSTSLSVPTTSATAPFVHASGDEYLRGREAGVRKCKTPDGPTWPCHVLATFHPSGAVSVVLREPFAGTPVGNCIIEALTSSQGPEFRGAPQTIVRPYY